MSEETKRDLAGNGTNVETMGDLIEMFVSGIVMAQSQVRSVLLLEDRKGKKVLPVWLAVGEDAIVRDQISGKIEASISHKAGQKILGLCGVQIKNCIFTDLTGNRQNVYLSFVRNGVVEGMQMRADEVMSFCIAHGARFWCSLSFIKQCREINSGIDESVPLAYERRTITERPQKYLI